MKLLNLSDRIAIVNSGELIGIVNASETNENEIGLMMAGVQKGGSKMNKKESIKFYTCSCY